ncbi:UDP-N-acetylglucosamine 2-epimerase [Marinagarivorans algicola]|uniref:UDP-N-acetylglucosamine 2-epimerase n=1 Tax=Marinagarivorans algicola TaxID=1513270 RepID=UPI0006B8F48C|nr:UDP-N-acetylglucosamine 2-epimerase [Marinagarivorans algicola]
MKKITVFTGTRAEYGLLFWLMKDIKGSSDLILQTIVSGTHLSPEFGCTYEEIERDGFVIDEKIEILLSSDTSVGVAKSMGLGVLGFCDAMQRLAPDLLIILGDRFEALAAAQTAMILRIPVLHLHGGEITEGAYDDSIRHAITKLSYLHAVSADEHRRRVIQLGENPARVENVGAIGLDHLKRTEFLCLSDLESSLGFGLEKPFFLVTYHPVTLANEPAEESFCELIKALDNFQQNKIIITYPNADDGGRKIIPLIEEYANSNPERVLAIKSLGQLRYLSAIKHCAAVIGNSSSGIIEVPSFVKPTVNIGARQKGRMAAQSVLSCAASEQDITSCIKRALQLDNEGGLKDIVNPYGDGNTSEKVLRMIRSADLKVIKTFYDQ